MELGTQKSTLRVSRMHAGSCSTPKRGSTCPQCTTRPLRIDIFSSQANKAWATRANRDCHTVPVPQAGLSASHPLISDDPEATLGSKDPSPIILITEVFQFLELPQTHPGWNRF